MSWRSRLIALNFVLLEMCVAPSLVVLSIHLYSPVGSSASRMNEQGQPGLIQAGGSKDVLFSRLVQGVAGSHAPGRRYARKEGLSQGSGAADCHHVEGGVLHGPDEFLLEWSQVDHAFTRKRNPPSPWRRLSHSGRVPRAQSATFSTSCRSNHSCSDSADATETRPNMAVIRSPSRMY